MSKPLYLVREFRLPDSSWRNRFGRGLKMKTILFFLGLFCFQSTLYSQPFFILSPGDKDISLVHSRMFSYPGPPSENYYLSYGNCSTNPPIIVDGITFCKGSSCASDVYVGMDTTANKVYYLRDGAKELIFDFSAPIGTVYNFLIPPYGASSIMRVTGDSITRIFDYEFSTVWGMADRKYVFVRNWGIVRHEGSTPDSESQSEIFETIRFTQSGDTLYSTTGYSPNIGFTARDTFLNPASTFKVSPSHSLNWIIKPTQPNFEFNKTLKMEYYYSSPLDSTPPQTKSFPVNDAVRYIPIPFDTILLNPDYSLKYRFSLTDKRLKPMTVYRPSNGSFYSIKYTGPLVGIKTDEPTADNQVGFSFSIFPNPVNDILNVECHNPEGTQTVFEIFDVTGKRLYYSLNDAGMNELNTRINIQELGLANGVYFLRVSSSGTRNYTKTAKFQVW